MNQAFMKDDAALGFQFHLEIDKNLHQGMLQHNKEDISRANFVQDETQILNDAGKMDESNRLMYKVLDRFFLKA